MSDLLALAERAEAASGAVDLNHLNGDILRGLGWTSDDRDVYDPQGHRRSGIPAYTTSLDDALSLVPDGWLLQGLDERNCALPNWRWKANLWRPDTGQEVAARAKNANVAALALCAAALRARAASTPSLNAEIAGMGEAND